MLTINISKHAQKFLEKVPLKHARQLKSKIQALMVNPLPPDTKQLVDYFPYRRADQGEYRIIYKVENEILYVVLVGKRNDDEVYKRMRQLLKSK